MAGCRLFVNNISFDTVASTFEDRVRRSVKGVKSVEFPMDGDRSRGFALVEFETPALAKEGLKTIPELVIDERKLRAREERSRVQATTGSAGGDRNAVRSTGSLFVANIPLNATAAEVQDVFERRGELKECVLLRERDSGVSRGVAFVTFVNPDNALRVFTQAKPIVMDGRPLKLQPRTNFEKQQTSENATVHINCPRTVKEADLRAAFGAFGDIVKVDVHAPRLYGFAVLRFASEAAARTAADRMNDKELSGHQGVLTVMLASEARARGKRDGPAKGQHPNHRSGDSGVLRFFEQCVYAPNDKNTPRPWSNKTHANALTFDAVVEQLNRGAQCVGDARAHLLFLWYILLQDSDRADAWSVPNNRGTSVSFRFVFLHSRVLETLVLRSFDAPFSSPVSDNALPSSCKLGVSELVLKIFSKTLIGTDQIHHDLLDGLEKLAKLGEGLPMQLRENVAQLIECFKMDQTNTEGYGSQLDDVSSRIAAAEAAHQSPAALLAVYEDQWRVLLKQAGVGNMGDVERVYQALSANIAFLAASNNATKRREQIQLLDDQLRVLRAQQQVELGEAGVEGKRVGDHVAALTAKKNATSHELDRLVGDLGRLESQRAALEKRKAAIATKSARPLAALELKKSQLQADLAHEEKKLSVFDEAVRLVDEAQKFTCEQVKDKRSAQSESMATLARTSLQCAHAVLSDHLKAIRGQNTRAQFCRHKLASMQREYEEMNQLDFADVAADYLKGIQRLSAELNAIRDRNGEALHECAKVTSWLRMMEDTGLLQQDTAAVRLLAKEIRDAVGQ